MENEPGSPTVSRLTVSQQHNMGKEVRRNSITSSLMQKLNKYGNSEYPKTFFVHFLCFLNVYFTV